MTLSPIYDLFISYADADRAWVEGYLLDALSQAGVHYHSEATFKLGVPRIVEFERAVRESARTLLILSPAYLADGFNQFTDLLAQNYGLETASWPVIPIILHHSITVPSRLTMLISLDASEPEHWTPAIERLCAELQRPVPGPTPPPDCPYPGMVPFRAQDARYFFGRDTEIRQMIMHLRHQRFLLIVGPSGSGKSSLIRAGLLPQLVHSTLFPARSWLVRMFRPGGHPISALAQALEGDLHEPKGRLTQLLAAHPPAQRLLLIVDQFEELFTQATPARQIRFITALNTLRTFESCTVIIIMRADFYPDLMNSDLWPVQAAQRFDIALLRGQALRQAIEQPAMNVGIYFDAGLIERLVADAANEPGALPLLQETMVLLWGQMQRHLLTTMAYDRLGSDGRSGLAVAMATKADATLASLSPTQQVIARRIFLRLIQFGEGRADTRRQQYSDALRAAGDDRLLFDQTLRHLVDNRLLTLSGEAANSERRVDIAHEALISGWATLGEWILERREAEQVRRRLEAKATEWARLGRSSGGLLDQAELPEAQRWLASADATDLGYEATLGALVEASRDALQEQEAQKSRAVRFRRLALTMIAILLIGALGLGLWSAQREAINQTAIAAQQQSARATAETYAAEQQALRTEAENERNRAREQADIATSHGLAAQAISLLDSQLDLALLLSVESYNARDTPEARKALLTALEHQPVTRFFQSGFVQDLAFSPNGAMLASTSDDAIVLWDVASGSQHGKILRSQGDSQAIGGVKHLAFSPDGATLASVGDYGSPVVLWDVASGELRKTQPSIETGRIPTVTFSPDGNILAVGLGFDQGIALWDVTAEKPGSRFDTGEQVNDVAFSPDGKLLVASVGGESGAVQLWDITTQQQVASLPMPDGAGTVAFSPDGALLAADTFGSRQTVLWSIATRQQAGPALNGSVSDQPFSADGAKIVLRGRDGIDLWDIATQQSYTFARGNSIGNIIVFSSDGQTLASGYDKEPVALWNITLGQRLAHSITGSGQTRRSGDTTGPIASVAYNIKGDVLAAGGANYDPMVWDVPGPTRRFDPIASHAGGTAGIALSADGKLLATGGNDGTVILWDTTNGKQHGDPFASNGDPFPAAKALAFSPDGTLLAVTGSGTVIWDVVTHKLRGKIPSGNRCIAFSPDGRLLATDEQHSIALWDTAALAQVGTFVHPEIPQAPYFTGLAFSPDGTSIAAVVGYGLAGGVQTSGYSTVLWNVATKQVHGAPLVSTSPLYSIAFSPAGSTLAVGSGTGTIQLWDVTTLQPIASLMSSGNSFITGLAFNFITGLAFNHDSSTLASMDLKGDVLLWDMNPVKWQEIACQIANHNLSQAEWARYLPQTPYRATCPSLPLTPVAPQ